MSELGTAAIGDVYSLHCLTSEPIGGLANRATVKWLDGDGRLVTTDGQATVGEPNIQTSNISLSLSFEALHTSHAGQYTCQASLSSPALGAPLVKISTAEVTLQSKNYTIATELGSILHK